MGQRGTAERKCTPHDVQKILSLTVFLSVAGWAKCFYFAQDVITLSTANTTAAFVV